MDPKITELVDFYTLDPTKWFRKSDEFDNELRDKYGLLVQQARNNELDALASTAEGSLALIILLDQIPRNIFRGSGESYSSDKKAQGIATQAIAKDFDQELAKQSKDRQMLFYMPLLHAEDLVLQVASRALMRSFAQQHPGNTDQERMMSKGAIDAAQKHLECVLQNGKFPARNEPMGREHTESDVAWLEEHPEGF